MLQGLGLTTQTTRCTNRMGQFTAFPPKLQLTRKQTYCSLYQTVSPCACLPQQLQVSTCLHACQTLGARMCVKSSSCSVLHAGLPVLQLLVQHQATTTPVQHTATPWQQRQHSACQEPCCQAPAVPLVLRSRICLVLVTITVPAKILQASAGVHRLSAWGSGHRSRSSSSRVMRVCTGIHLDLVNTTGAQVCDQQQGWHEVLIQLGMRDMSAGHLQQLLPADGASMCMLHVAVVTHTSAVLMCRHAQLGKLATACVCAAFPGRLQQKGQHSAWQAGPAMPLQAALPMTHQAPGTTAQQAAPAQLLAVLQHQLGPLPGVWLMQRQQQRLQRRAGLGRAATSLEDRTHRDLLTAFRARPKQKVCHGFDAWSQLLCTPVLLYGSNNTV